MRGGSLRPPVLIALVPLAFILFFVVSQGVQALNLEFFTEMPQPGRRSRRRHGERDHRAAHHVRIGALLAVPIGVMSGIYVAGV